MARGQNTPPSAKPKKHPSSNRSALRHATRLVHQVCCLAGAHTLVDEIRSTGAPNTLGSLIESLDTPALFNWLIDTLSYQGISDRVATAYIEEHGSITWAEIEYRLSKKPSCPKLRSYWHYHGCRYSKQKRTCACPEHYSRCPLPKHRLRNGRINQIGYSLYFFLRDAADSDLINWIDRRFSQVVTQSFRRRALTAAMRESLLGPLRHIYGVADKVLSMALANILLAAQDERTHWHETGGSMLAIDTLVHNFLHRTGILAEFKAEHPYGLRCYGKDARGDHRKDRLSNRCPAVQSQFSQYISPFRAIRNLAILRTRDVRYLQWQSYR